MQHTAWADLVRLRMSIFNRHLIYPGVYMARDYCFMQGMCTLCQMLTVVCYCFSTVEAVLIHLLHPGISLVVLYFSNY